MRIALVTDAYWPRVNGVSVSVQTFRDQLEASGHHTLVLAPAYPKAGPDPLAAPEGPGQEPRPLVKRFRSVGARISKEDRVLAPEAFPAVFRALDEFNPDIVHFNSEFGLFFAGRLWCRRRHKPIFITCHTNWEFYIKHYAPWLNAKMARRMARHYLRRAYRDADYVLIPSPQMGELLKGYGLCGPFHTLPTGIDPDFFSSSPEEVAAFRASLDQAAPGLAGRRLLLFAGRIGQEKNVSFLLPVLKAVRSAGHDAALLCIGDGPYREELLAEARAAGLEAMVHAPGYLPRAELRLAYAAASVFTFPSVTETQGLATIEAMLCGTPVVAIGEMGTKYVMQGDNGGFMVEHRLEDFSQAVCRLLEDPELYASKRTEARAWAQRFSVAETTRQLLGHYQDCLAGKGRRDCV